MTSAKGFVSPVSAKAPVSTIALGQFTVVNNILTAVSLYGITSVMRITAGRYRCTLATPQPDVAYNPRSDLLDTTAKFSRIGAKTTANFEILVSALSVAGTALGMTAADASEVFFSAERKN